MLSLLTYIFLVNWIDPHPHEQFPGVIADLHHQRHKDVLPEKQRKGQRSARYSGTATMDFAMLNTPQFGCRAAVAPCSAALRRM